MKQASINSAAHKHPGNLPLTEYEKGNLRVTLLPPKFFHVNNNFIGKPEEKTNSYSKIASLDINKSRSDNTRFQMDGEEVHGRDEKVVRSFFSFTH